jgi:hypothetical protein
VGVPGINGHTGMKDDVRANYHKFFKFGADEFETGEARTLSGP